MATTQYFVSTEKSTSFYANYHRAFLISEINAKINEVIPSYSKINTVTAKFEAKRSGVDLETSNTDARIYFDNEASASDGTTLAKWSNAIGTSYKEFSTDITGYVHSENNKAGQINTSYNRLFFASIGISPRTHYLRNLGVYWDYTPSTFVISLSAGAGGTVSGAGTYEVGSTATIEATPNAGYRFVKWSDGNTNATRQITKTSNDISANVTRLSYTATFEPIQVGDVYVTYDNLFDFRRWANNNLKSWTLMNISNVTNTGFTGQGLYDDAYTEECRPIIAVTKGKTYTFECNTSGGGFEFFIFNCNSAGGWADFTYGNTNKFNFTPSQDYISIRCDVIGTGTVVNFDNFRIYPADCPYMSNSVSADQRTNIKSWNMPTPTREGYIFTGWNTKPDGTGTTYTSSSAYPKADLVLYSQWRLNNSYVTYDSLFSFKRWKETNLASNSFISVSDVTDIGFKGTALVDDAYTDECRPLIPVVAGKEYTIEVDVETNVGFQLFVFHCDANGAWGNLSLELNARRYNFVPTTNYISIRCDVDGKGNVAKYSNFRIYPSDCPYMSNTLSAAERTDFRNWSMPTPTREGYRFLGWNTKPDGSGTTYTSSSPYPTSDLVLYSQWVLDKINKILCDTSKPSKIYIDNQEVKAIYIDTTKVYG